MKTYKVLFLPHNKEVKVPENSSLIHAAMEAGVHINASCGGEGVCGKCRILIEQGEVKEGISEKLTDQEIKSGYRLACLCQINQDLVIRVPIESDVDQDTLNMQSTPRYTAKIKSINLNDLKEQGLFFPPVEKKYIELPSPTIQDNVSDVTRVVRFLKENQIAPRIEITLPVIRKIPRIIRENDFKVTITLAHPVNEGRKTRIINIHTGDKTIHNYAIAMDVGTTTIYGQIVDLITGNVIAEHGEFNSQIRYGEDVITRIVFAEKPGGLEKLNQAVLEIINQIIAQIIKKADIDPDDISKITIAGNTTMTQLLLKIDPRHIRRAPYVPASNLFPPIQATDIGINLDDHVTALVYPQISSYVGGDIVAGVMGSGMYRSDELTVYMDIGTNAEIVIGNKEWLVCAACSAGPAFEGGGIKLGMRATQGAIEDFSIDPITLEPMNVTIGRVRPKGICGSGLITMVATMFEFGIIDNSGKFNRDLKTNRIREVDGVYEYVVAWKESTQIDRDVVLTEPDIDNLIRAKGAMYSGCVTLLEEVGLTFDNIDKIILAGGFGSYIDLQKAMTIGLLPEINPEKIIFVGNGSLMGARMSSLTNRIRKDIVEVTHKMTNFELSETPSYMNNYIAALFLPHTDLNHFPKLNERLKQRRELLKKQNQ